MPLRTPIDKLANGNKVSRYCPVDVTRTAIIEEIGIAARRLGADCQPLFRVLIEAADDQEIVSTARALNDRLKGMAQEANCRRRS
jgi:hypothetical protein